MDQLPPHDVRTGQPVQPGPVGYRHHPLRHPQHCHSLFPLIPAVRSEFVETALHGAVFDSGPIGTVHRSW
nr:hypothetical protein [Rhizobium sp. CG5]